MTSQPALTADSALLDGLALLLARRAAPRHGAIAAGPAANGADLALGGDLARAAYGVGGAGIRIGILSDSFNLLGGEAQNIASGALPAATTIVKEGPAGGTDEGRAMAEIIHAIAPQAQIFFYTAFDGQADFANGITTLASQYHTQVIVDDVSYLNEPFYQDGGAIQTAVEAAVAAGADYFTAASNEGRNFYEHSFQTMTATLPGLPGSRTLDNFGTTQHPRRFESLTVPAGGSIAIDLQWAAPFASIGGGKGSPDSLGMYLYGPGGRLVGSAAQTLTGGDPVQVLDYTNHGANAVTLRLAIADTAGAAPSQFKFIVYGNATIDDPKAGLGSGSVIGHEMVAGANTVGAVPYYGTPRYGDPTPAAEPFSSIGPGEWLYGRNGAPLTRPQFLGKVDFMAPDGAATSVFDPFYGTSAAAPAAAALAALMLQADPALSTGQVSAILAASALPMGPGSGAGLLQALPALAMAAAQAGHAAAGHHFGWA